MRYKKLIALFLCAGLCLSSAAAVEEDTDAADPNANVLDVESAKVPVTGLAPDAPSLKCMAGVLLCAENGQILLDKGGDKKLAPASITKLMTALVVFENVPDLSVTTTVSDVAVHSIEPGSTHIALDTGEVVTLKDMMGAMLVESANDASNVLAEYVGGSLEGFADMMNEKAKEIGCTNTHFVNANGLDDPEHYTTAHDMALIGAALCEYPEVFDYLGASVYAMPATNKQAEERQFWTKQNFLRKNSQWYDENVLGGKNGWTTNAHQTLVTFKRVDNVTLVAAVLCGTSKSNTLSDTAAMFSYGFDNFRAVTLPPEELAAAAQISYPNADIDALQSALLLLPSNMKERNLTYACDEADGEPILRVQEDHDTLLSIPLTLMTAGAPTGGELDGETIPASAALQDSGSFGSSVLRAGLITVGVVVFLFLLLCLYRWTRIRKNRRRIHAMRERAHRQNYGDKY